MTQFDREWNRVAENILANGTWQDVEHVRAKWEDGTEAPAKFVTGEKMIFDNSEALVPQDKFLPEQAPKFELDWIWRQKSNKLEDLRKLGIKIWDKWEIKEGEWAGTIGPAYGYQLGKKCRRFPISKLQWGHLKPEEAEIIRHQMRMHSFTEFVLLDQVDFLIQTLLTNPGSRRLVTTLINIMDLDWMALEPCVWKTKWAYVAGKLDLIVGVRSNDICVGNPFNVYQYQVLQHMICQVVGLEPGKIQFDIDDAHIYDRHIPEALNQIRYEKDMAMIMEDLQKDEPKVEAEHNFTLDLRPQLWLNPAIKNFYEFDMKKDIKLENYVPGPKREFEVAE